MIDERVSVTTEPCFTSCAKTFALLLISAVNKSIHINFVCVIIFYLNDFIYFKIYLIYFTLLIAKHFNSAISISCLTMHFKHSIFISFHEIGHIALKTSSTLN